MRLFGDERQLSGEQVRAAKCPQGGSAPPDRRRDPRAPSPWGARL